MYNIIEMPSKEVFTQELLKQIENNKKFKLLQMLKKHTITIYEKIISFFERIFSRSSNSTFQSKEAQTILLICVIILILIIIGTTIWLFARSFKKDIKTKKILGEILDENINLGDLREKSKAYAQEGKYRKAVRWSFIAILFYLHDNNILYHEDSMTGNEMVEKLEKQGFPLVLKIKELVCQFNEIWYGIFTIKESKYKKWLSCEDAFWKSIQEMKIRF